jgi:hypothetical protein
MFRYDIVERIDGATATLATFEAPLALAVVGAVLAALISTRLGVGEGASAASQRLVTGDFAGAMNMVPNLSPATLRSAYDTAFAQLFMLLSGVTLITAVVVFLALGRRGSVEDQALTTCEVA